jgi:hypothetical protein
VISWCFFWAATNEYPDRELDEMHLLSWLFQKPQPGMCWPRSLHNDWLAVYGWRGTVNLTV